MKKLKGDETGFCLLDSLTLELNLFNFLFLVCTFAVGTAAIAENHLGDAFESLSTENTPTENAPPPAPPTRIENFIFSSARSPRTAEDSVQMTWKRVSFGDEYRVYRQVLQLIAGQEAGTTAFVPPPQERVSPEGWALIKTSRQTGFNGFQDEDIPPINMELPPESRRRLGMVYCYRVEASGNGREAISPVICTRHRGLNAPRIESFTSFSPSQIGIIWEDLSVMAPGYKVMWKEDEGVTRTRTIMASDLQYYRTVLNGLLPETEYCVWVQSIDLYGGSANESAGCVWTEQEPDPEPNSEPDPKPDLAFNGSMTLTPTFPGANTPFTLTWRVCNIGNGPTGDFKDVAQLDGDQAVFEESVSSTAAGACYERSVSHQGLPAGNHFWYVYIDGKENVAESNESNNTNYYGFDLNL